MRWRRGQRSADLEDRRGEGAYGGGFRRGVPGGARMGLGGLAILLVLSLVTGQNFFALFEPGGTGSGIPGSGPGRPARPASPQEEEMVQFVSFVLDDAQATWAGEFRKLGRPYENAKLVLFTDAVDSACGYAQSAMGPFYCPMDQKVYVDLGFYRELKDRFGAPGDFAQAYVLAHEIGHHVQQLLGTAGKVRQLQETYPREAAGLSVRLELQADCLAGVWGHTTRERSILESGDVEEGLGAAAAVGDDRIQRQATGSVNPETWTHGSSRQRVAWFNKGLASGRLQDCDTFGSTAAIGADRG